MSGPENPQAFPCDFSRSGMGPEFGMTLRDWFAGQADQPGISETVSMAGLRTDGFWVEFNDGAEKLKFNDWWNGLPLAERCLLAARVRYALADAMLIARAAISRALPDSGGEGK